MNLLPLSQSKNWVRIQKESHHAGVSAAKNPEGIFKYFIDKMLDGGDVQMLWTHGAKGTHWDDKAETVTVEKKEDQPKTYTEGQFHYLPGISLAGLTSSLP